MNKSSKNLPQQEQFRLLKPELTVAENNLQSNIADSFLQKRIGFLERLFPGSTDREVIRHQSRLTAQESARLLSNHEIMKSFEEKAIREALNNVLQNGMVVSRMNTSRSFAENMMLLQRTLNEILESFDRIVDKSFEKLFETKTEYLRKRQEKDLMRQVDNFHDAIEKLMIDFQSITKNLIE